MDLFSIAEMKKKKYKVGNYDGKSNYHTHTYYCDGKDAPEDLVARAIELGFTSLGFSGHQYSVPDEDYAMTPEAEKNYRKDILELKDKYKDDIKIYLGIERDYYCETTPGFDYVIGSIHHVDTGDGWVNVDESPEVLEEGVRKYFDGDYMAYVEAYFAQETKVLEKTKGQIVGHFDLVTKFNRGNRYFDEKDPAYKRIALNSCEELAQSFYSSKAANNVPNGFPEELAVLLETGFPIFEINTGATIKGLRELPYPATFIVEHLMEMGVPLIFSSDCHDRRYLDFGFQALMNRYGQ